MKYKEQLYVILSFISVRILTLILFVFYKPAQPGAYTPYIIALYAVCEVLVLFYLYHFVKRLKGQQLSLVPFLLLALIIVYMNTLQFYIYPLDRNKFIADEFMYVQLLLTIPAYLLKTISEIIIAVQLLKNKAKGSLNFCLRMQGWSYLLMIAVTLGAPILSSWFISHKTTNYISQFSSFIPLCAMLLLYGNELRIANTNDTDSASVVDQYI